MQIEYQDALLLLSFEEFLKNLKSLLVQLQLGQGANYNNQGTSILRLATKSKVIKVAASQKNDSG